MAGKRQAEFWGFLRYGEVRLARRMVVHLDEIDSAGLKLSDRFSGLLGASHAAPERKLWRSIVENRSGRDNLGSKQLAAIYALSERQDEFKICTHVAGADHAAREK